MQTRRAVPLGTPTVGRIVGRGGPVGVRLGTAVCVWASAPVALGQGLQLRGGEPAPAGQVIGVDAAGVHLGPAPVDGKSAAETVVVSWDRVAAVQGNTNANTYATVAEEAWRARTRMERSDFISAEPLLERLYDQYKGQKGATGAVIAEGLLRCRLRRGAHVLAIEPWLSMLRAESSPHTPVLHEAWAAEAGLPTVIDSSTGLIPALPPIWLSWPAVDSFAKGRDPTPPVSAKATAADARADILSQIYYQAARFEAGLPASLPELATNDPGVAIAWQVVQARIGDPEQREAVRRLLRDRLRPPPALGPVPLWLEAWIHAALGRSLVREEATEQRQEGVIELLNLPARFSRTHPYLCGIALAESSATLRSLGDQDGADLLARELIASYPSHPVNDWLPFRTSKPKSAPAPARPAPLKEGEIPQDAPVQSPK